MGKITVPNNLSNLDSIKELQRFLSAFVNSVYATLNGGITFQENIRSTALKTVTFLNSSDVQKVTHSLNRQPAGFLVVKSTGPAMIYAPAGSSYTWSNTEIFLQSSAAATISIYII